ncbi:MAG: methyltransferase domain-containing protein, partial [Simkania sp.]|nr:methyltransferase domain-containing protein [Simkania sp.]
MNYPLSYGEHAINHFTRRRAAEKARFLLPHLKENFHLLDCGCGPGSITVDLAEFLKKGHVSGIDLDSSQFLWGQNEAHRRGIE